MIHAIDCEFDYDLGYHEVLLSGSVGSAKSLLAAHCGIKHCLMYPGARLLIARKALPDIKRTIFQTILEHLECEELKEGQDYFVKNSIATIHFSNGSEIIPIYWNDKKFKRIRSLNISCAIIEELTENDIYDWQAFTEIKARIGRLPHIKEKWLIACTNPDSPRHPAYQYFIEPGLQGKQSPTRHVFYSLTEQNPFLPKTYIEQLKKDLDPKQARRLLYGEWIEVDEDRIYHSYQSERNFKTRSYEIKKGHPIALCFDFNIGFGKPMSSCAYQYIDDTFHVFDQSVVFGARTIDVMEEWLSKGVFNLGCPIIVHGDATGAARTTKSIHSDYEIIEKFLKSIQNLSYKMQVPRDNPPVRLRHNRVNAYCYNEKKEVRLFVYKEALTMDEGFRLTALKKGGEYIEDDSKHYQHITTAIGYGIVYDTSRAVSKIVSQKNR